MLHRNKQSEISVTHDQLWKHQMLLSTCLFPFHVPMHSEIKKSLMFAAYVLQENVNYSLPISHFIFHYKLMHNHNVTQANVGILAFILSQLYSHSGYVSSPVFVKCGKYGDHFQYLHCHCLLVT